MALKVFVDFDGTVTRHDVGNAFFRHFGGPECANIVREYLDGAISATECFRREVAALGPLNESEVLRFLEGQSIDETFGEFVVFCRSSGAEVFVVSDGLDYYIARVLSSHGIGGVPFFANGFELQSSPNGGASWPVVRFPFTDAECTRCACCKRNIMLTHSGEDDGIVYVGEGYSDRCAVLYADVVFAKDALQTFCRQENVSYFPYRTFRDVAHRLDTLLQRKALPKCRRAELRRREAFIRE